jgi:hypothetical protein
MPHSVHGSWRNAGRTRAPKRATVVSRRSWAPSNRRRELLSQLFDTALHADLRIKGKRLFISSERGLPIFESVVSRSQRERVPRCASATMPPAKMTTIRHRRVCQKIQWSRGSDNCSPRRSIRYFSVRELPMFTRRRAAAKNPSLHFAHEAEVFPLRDGDPRPKCAKFPVLGVRRALKSRNVGAMRQGRGRDLTRSGFAEVWWYCAEKLRTVL